MMPYAMSIPRLRSTGTLPTNRPNGVRAPFPSDWVIRHAGDECVFEGMGWRGWGLSV